MPQPSDAQKEAGNYAKDHIRLHGLALTIENRKGTVRSGKSKDGSPWSVVCPFHYGYFKRTTGADGDHVDVFLGAHRESQFVVVVNQHDRQTRVFDEVKVGLGYLSLDQAKAAYRAGYRGANVPHATFKTTTIQGLKDWLESGLTRHKFHASVRLTELGSGMKRVVQFRSPTPEAEADKPSVARRVAGAVGAGLALGGFYRYVATRPAAKKRAFDLAKRQAAAEQAHGNRLKMTSYVSDLNKGTPKLGSAPYSDGGFDYGVKAAAPKTASPKSTAPRSTPKVEVSTRRAPAPAPSAAKRGAVLQQKVLGKVTPKIRAKARVKTSLMARIVATHFQERNQDGTLGVSTSPLHAYRQASRVAPWVGRAGKTAGDLGDMATGKEVKDPFYKKSWFKRAAVTAAIGAPLLAANLAHSGARKIADGVPVRTGNKLGDRVDRLTRIAARGRAHLQDKLGLAAKIKNPVLLQAVVAHLQNFDARGRHVEFMKVVGGGFRPPVPGTLPDDYHAATAGGFIAPEHVVANLANGGISFTDHETTSKALKHGVLLRRSPEFYGALDRDTHAFYGKQGVAKNVQAHELVHAIQHHRQGPVKSVLDSAKREWGAYSRTLIGKDADRKMVGGASKAMRAGNAALLTARSTLQNWKNDPKLKLFRAASLKQHDFDYRDRNDWDLRDARGKSARVFAPGSKPRNRREKTWDEKTDNIRLVRNIAIAGTLAGVGAALHYRNKANKLTPRAPAVLDNLIRPDFTKKAMSARVRPVQFKGKLMLTNLTDSVGRNVHLPDRPEVPGEGAAKLIYALPPKPRAGVLRVLGAGAVAGGGTLVGVALKKPKTGAVLGGLGAGMILKS